jgi:hypothetical protein
VTRRRQKWGHEEADVEDDGGRDCEDDLTHPPFGIPRSYTLIVFSTFMVRVLFEIHDHTLQLYNY